MLAQTLNRFSRPPAPPATQVFDAEPTDAQLATWVDADHDMIWYTVEDNTNELSVRPAPVPLWFVMVCVSLPAVLFIAWLVSRVMDAGFDGIEAVAFLVGVPMALLAWAGVVALFHVLNRRAERTPASFVLDKSRQTLSLPRFDVTLPHARLVAVVEVRGPYRPDETREARLNHHEVSVLARDEAGRLVRYPLKLVGHHKRTIKAGRAIAEEMGVPLRQFEV